MTGFVACPGGGEHWGLDGAAGLALWACAGRGGLLLQKRSAFSHQGGSWSVLGGALEDGENPVSAALREAAEEAVIDLSGLSVYRSIRSPCPVAGCGWTYTTVVASVPGEPAAAPHSWESEALRWTPLSELEAAIQGIGGPVLHAGLLRALPEILVAIRADPPASRATS